LPRSQKKAEGEGNQETAESRLEKAENMKAELCRKAGYCRRLEKAEYTQTHKRRRQKPGKGDTADWRREVA